MRIYKVLILTAVIILCAVRIPSLIALTLAVAVHEFGHILTAKALGINLTKVKGRLFGLRMTYGNFGGNLIKELAVSAAGSIFGFMSAAVVYLTPLFTYDSCFYFAMVSWVLSVFNLLPIRTLDGGAIAEAILDRITLPDRSQRILNLLSVIFSVLFWCAAVRIQLRNGPQLSILLIAVYLLCSSVARA